MNRIAKEFIALLRERNQYGQLAEIVEDLKREVDRHHGVTIVSASPLSQDERKELEATVTKRWGDHDIHVSVDPSIVSGVIIRFGHQIIDRSGKAATAHLSASLTDL